MITKPELDKFPVGPRKKRMVLFGSLLGLFFGSIAAFLTDKKRGYIYDVNEIQKILEVNLTENLNINDEDDSYKGLKLIFENSFDNSDNTKIAVLPISNLSEGIMEHLKALLLKIKTKKIIKLINDVTTLKNYNYVLLISAEGIINKQQLIKLKKRISIQKVKIAGLIQINE